MKNHNLDSIYQRTIPLVIRDNKKIEEELGIKQHDFTRFYRSVEIPFSDDGRILHVRILKIPTFIIENKPRFYTLIFSTIEMWRKGEIRQLHAQIAECFDNHDVDSYTIFQQGDFYGYFDPVLNKNTRQYNMFILHGNTLTKKQLVLITRVVINYLESRCKKITNNQIVYSRLKQDVARLRCFNENFEMLFKPIEKPIYSIVRE